MRYGSVCSGIEAATEAWHPLGWEPAFFSEIDPWARAALEARHPHVPLHGDFTTIGAEDYGPIDLLVGGTPCQSFSIAGLRGGLGDERGNLALEFLRLAARKRPQWVVWENVPGVLSSSDHDAPDPRPPAIDLDGDHGPADGTEVVVDDEYEADENHAFASILAGFSELGYGWAYRVLDAQYTRTCRFPRAVPQRRRRVLVVGYLGDRRPPAAVLFDRQSLRGDPPPRRKAGKAAPTVPARSTAGGGLGTDFDCDGGLIPEVANPLTARMAKGINTTLDEGQTPIVEAVTGAVAHTLTGEGFDASEDGSGRGNPIIAFDCRASHPATGDQGEAPTLRAMRHDKSHANGGGQLAVAFAENSRAELRLEGGDGGVAGAISTGGGKPGQGSPAVAVAFDMRGREGVNMPEGPHDTANIRAASGGSSRSYVATPVQVRRLTPRECERLMGFPDDATNIPWRGKNGSPDGRRYSGLGNSMAVNCMEWIGQRIALVAGILKEEADA